MRFIRNLRKYIAHKIEQREWGESPYCPICKACGERPCCPDEKCQHSIFCKYKDIYVKLPKPFKPDRWGYYWARDKNEVNCGDLYIVQVGWSDEHNSFRVFRFELLESESLDRWEIFKGPLAFKGCI